MRSEDIEESFKLSNGAELIREETRCDICIKRRESPELASFKLRHEGSQLFLCEAHAQEVLDLDDDHKWKKGGTLSQMFES